MTEIAFKVIRLGTSLCVIAFRPPGSHPLLHEKYPFNGGAIKDDGNANAEPKERFIDQRDIPFETWNTQPQRGLKKGGFKLKINHEAKRISLTPISPRSKNPINDKQITYNFQLFGIEDDRTTAIEQAKDSVEYRVRKRD